MRINLLKDKEGLYIIWVEIAFVFIVILTLALPGLHYFVNYIELQDLETERNQLENQVQALRPQEEYYFELQQQIEDFRLPEEVEVQRYAISPAIEEFGVILPNQAALRTLNFQNGELAISGHAREIEVILDMVGNIFESEIFSLVSLQQFQRDDVIDFDLQVSMHTREELP